MRVVIDANILIDVLAKREPHFLPSARVTSLVAEGRLAAIVPPHVVPNVYFIIRKASGRRLAENAADWILSTFESIPLTFELMRESRKLSMADFEDAIVAVTAQLNNCDYVVTRDHSDFAQSPVPQISPAALLNKLGF